jgi:hypothetical protein
MIPARPALITGYTPSTRAYCPGFYLSDIHQSERISSRRQQAAARLWMRYRRRLFLQKDPALNFSRTFSGNEILRAHPEVVTALYANPPLIRVRGPYRHRRADKQ